MDTFFADPVCYKAFSVIFVQAAFNSRYALWDWQNVIVEIDIYGKMTRNGVEHEVMTLLDFPCLIEIFKHILIFSKSAILI